MQSYKIAGIHVAHQNIDGEVIAVNLLAGFYFSISGSGPIIWDRVISGASRSQIVEHLSYVYDASRAEIEEAVDVLVQHLLYESLIIKSDHMASNKSPTLPQDGLVKQPFEPATFEKYTDMDRALVLDPIHDSAETGWPNQTCSEPMPGQSIDKAKIQAKV